jgi:hypothetical protein
MPETTANKIATIEVSTPNKLPNTERVIDAILMKFCKDWGNLRVEREKCGLRVFPGRATFQER